MSKQRLETTEVPFVESTLWAPSGLIPTAEERAYMADLQTKDDGSVDTDREPVGHGGSRMTVKEAFAGVRWYLREVSGETAYDRYVEHLRRDHPDAIVMSRRDFERCAWTTATPTRAPAAAERADVGGRRRDRPALP